MILLIDNYDSFVYNLARYVSECGHDYLVKRNNEISLEEIADLNPSHIIISPGPCTPNEAGISLDLIKKFSGKIPLLGICLGHQAIAQACGGKVVPAEKPVHGKASKIRHNENGIFNNTPNPLEVGRYHSLIVSEKNFPAELEIIARAENGEIMAIAHKKHFTVGLQFHPESVLTQHGHDLIGNFLNIFKNPSKGDCSSELSGQLNPAFLAG